MATLNIRPAKLDDCDSIQKLTIQLGYQPEREMVLSGLTAMQSNPDYEVVVLVEGELVLGLMTLCTRYRIEDVPFLQVAALVTEEKRRGTGLGKKLMEYAESQARKKNLPFVGLHTSKRREDAHRFYEKAGYERAKESFFYSKKV